MDETQFTIEHQSTFHWGAFTYDVRCFGGIFDRPTYPDQMQLDLPTYLPTYLPKNLTSYVNAPYDEV